MNTSSSEISSLLRDFRNTRAGAPLAGGCGFCDRQVGLAYHVGVRWWCCVRDTPFACNQLYRYLVVYFSSAVHLQGFTLDLPREIVVVRGAAAAAVNTFT